MAAPTYSRASTITLNNGIAMPRIHLGVYMTSGDETSNAVTAALRCGYRAIDSAEWYENEAEVGRAIAAFVESEENTAGLERGDVWFTTKLRENRGYEATRRAIRKSIQVSGLGYVDLFLLHSPYGGRERRRECWRAVEDAVGEGEVRAAGVSNFGVRHLQELLDSAPRIVPAVNQIEVHPFNTQTAITAFCARHGIVVQAYAPLVRAMRMRHPVIVELAGKYGCVPAQLLVRWSLQKGYVPLPKSAHAARIDENARVEGFEIADEDVKRLDGLDEHLVTDWDPTDAP